MAHLAHLDERRRRFSTSIFGRVESLEGVVAAIWSAPRGLDWHCLSLGEFRTSILIETVCNKVLIWNTTDVALLNAERAAMPQGRLVLRRHIPILSGGVRAGYISGGTDHASYSPVETPLPPSRRFLITDGARRVDRQVSASCTTLLTILQP